MASKERGARQVFIGIRVRPGTREKSRRFAVATAYPSSNAQAAIIKSARGRFIPLAACSPPMRAMNSADRNAGKIAQICGGHSVSEFQCAGCDYQIGEG